MVWRVLLGVALAFFAALFGFFYYLNSRGVTEEELRRRCASAQPTWQSYQEDIKAQVGAGPVAEWEGRPVEARFSPREVVVVFELRGAWAARDAGLPTLLRVPTGETIAGAAIGSEGSLHTYRFPLPADVEQPPWAELRYPHETVRMVPEAGGYWRSPTTAAE